jgi:hypothetical protein
MKALENGKYQKQFFLILRTILTKHSALTQRWFMMLAEE